MRTRVGLNMVEFATRRSLDRSADQEEHEDLPVDPTDAVALPPFARRASALLVCACVTLALASAMSMALWPDLAVLEPALAVAHGVAGGGLTVAVVVLLIGVLFVT